MTILRSLLFIPGNQPNMLEKAQGLKPDAFVPDLEDSVPDDEKAVGGALILEIQGRRCFGPVASPHP